MMTAQREPFSPARNRTFNVIAVALLFLFLWWADGSMAADLGISFLPEPLNGYEVQILNLVAVYGILAISLNIIYGFTGMFSLGHAGFMAIGAYVSALCVLTPDQKEIMWIIDEILPSLATLHTPFWFSVILGGVVATLFALVIGIPVLRLGGDYLGIATLGFSEIIRVLIVNATPITNGSLGIKGIPCHTDLFTSYIWLLLVIYCTVRLLSSNFGNVLKAVRDDEIAAQVMGINVFHTKLFSFCLGAFLAGVGGALLGNLLTTIDPKMFTFLLTYNILMIVVAGGLGSITGSIIGSVIITVLLEWLRVVEEPMDLGFMEIPGIPGMRMVVFSVCLLLIILYRREGIMGMREITWDGIAAFLFRIRGRKENKA
ncbi:branched-chain amino acid ABC transporter permease [uncultured Mailhella sp.]|uniref:branched-chain amino acid ABC transporter permease n=1 Tax=uncultured Mailhella sp. TaxID=1981031 RepID=UPI0025CE4E43|nr:branched-chain amino acid ABC transporter permease [uncultured Mailhella sp.]